MFLWRYERRKNGKPHSYWALVESYRTAKRSRHGERREPEIPPRGAWYIVGTPEALLRQFETAHSW